MAVVDYQLMVKNETTWGTPVTPDRAFALSSESIAEQFGRTEGNALIKGDWFAAADQHLPYFAGAAGTIEFDVMTRGFGWWLNQMLGDVNTSGPTDEAYTHTGSFANLDGTGFTCQIGRPRNPSGTVQAFTYEGGKVSEWEISNSVDSTLVLSVGCDFQQVATGTALATWGTPTLGVPLTWAGGVVTVGGAQVALDDIAISVNNGLNVDRRKIDGSTDKKEQSGNRREGTFSMNLDFENITALRAFAAATTSAGTMAEVVATWTGPAVIGGGATYPSFTVTAQCRFDEWAANISDATALTQTVGGVIRVDGGDSVEIVYVSADSTA